MLLDCQVTEIDKSETANYYAVVFQFHLKFNFNLKFYYNFTPNINN